ncbi:peptidoglycan amidohydrolase family protein [Leuconostoc pseudomesenteroides]|uniref:Peptidoglycan amidohydrolase family protein n=1 Tax=Leuconostoc pseudomesenteroides TaxID=33968 RepID=A0A5B8T2W9_LEUPS|nr:peptidoglycan amidohydrolase family protein [Leuconostoc pseudomesenteroides]MCC8440410.1 hypothetical protein [Leuconostoc pseudomesenteroides]MDG9733362.1 peptidoglycan amidohydrolase family protein [Leuconostoc pseudomesenteroides]NKZ36491.1 hypothetical protein [Leuconostoc pseudomesenteroides]QEA42717.1 hypothetical protein FGL85_09495 [Leuconostoc pseudomesenteroides]QQB26837.1 C40 family peptidase [Leuconostoc pseudomesenteroides]
MYNKDIAVTEALSWQHQATYSMQLDLRDGVEVDGTTYFNCASFIYYVLAKAGAWHNTYLQREHNIGTLQYDLLKAGWVEVDSQHVSKGDVFIWGDDYGISDGAHTGLFVNNGKKIIHSSWYTAGQHNEAVTMTNYASYWELANKPEYHFFKAM